MDGVPLYEVSKLLRHASITMTEKYAHLAPDHLHQVVANSGFSAHLRGGAHPLLIFNLIHLSSPHSEGVN